MKLIRKVFKTIIFIIAVLFVTSGIVYLYYSFHQKDLTVSYYKVSAPISQDLRILQLTDLHNAEFGENNADLVALVQEQDPDIIVMTGDMINKDDPDTDIITDLIGQLAEIAPVYYGYGNHEVTWEKNFGDDLEQTLEDAGAIVLNSSYVDVRISDTDFRFGGFMGYYGVAHMLSNKDAEVTAANQEFFMEFEDTDSYKILLDHIPTTWVDWDYTDKCDVDLIFSGHYHGGQWVLPLVGPVYAPYVGWFPEHVRGLYQGRFGTCILSSGLGNEYTWLLRINNPPEITVTDLLAAGS